MKEKLCDTFHILSQGLLNRHLLNVILLFQVKVNRLADPTLPKNGADRQVNRLATSFQLKNQEELKRKTDKQETRRFIRDRRGRNQGQKRRKIDVQEPRRFTKDRRVRNQEPKRRKIDEQEPRRFTRDRRGRNQEPKRRKIDVQEPRRFTRDRRGRLRCKNADQGRLKLKIDNRGQERHKLADEVTRVLGLASKMNGLLKQRYGNTC